jgi:hypothetical protein
VAKTLRQTAANIGRRKIPPKHLDIVVALNAARSRLVVRALLTGPLDEQGVAAASGLSAEIVRPALDWLVERNLAKCEADDYVGDTDRIKADLD